MICAAFSQDALSLREVPTGDARGQLVPCIFQTPAPEELTHLYCLFRTQSKHAIRGFHSRKSRTKASKGGVLGTISSLNVELILVQLVSFKAVIIGFVFVMFWMSVSPRRLSSVEQSSPKEDAPWRIDGGNRNQSPMMMPMAFFRWFQRSLLRSEAARGPRKTLGMGSCFETACYDGK